jgi:hypothetical protein
LTHIIDSLRYFATGKRYQPIKELDERGQREKYKYEQTVKAIAGSNYTSLFK